MEQREQRAGDETASAGARRRNLARSAVLADAPGRALPAGISRVEEERRQLPRSLPHARARRRGDAAADPALRHGCGDPVLGHPGGAACAGPGRSRSRDGEGPVLDAGTRRPMRLRTLSVDGAPERLAPVYETVRRVGMSLPRGDRAHRLCRRPWTVATYMVEGGTSRDFAMRRAGPSPIPTGSAG